MSRSFLAKYSNDKTYFVSSCYIAIVICFFRVIYFLYFSYDETRCNLQYRIEQIKKRFSFIYLFSSLHCIKTLLSTESSLKRKTRNETYTHPRTECFLFENKWKDENKNNVLKSHTNIFWIELCRNKLMKYLFKKKLFFIGWSILKWFPYDSILLQYTSTIYDDCASRKG